MKTIRFIDLFLLGTPFFILLLKNIFYCLEYVFKIFSFFITFIKSTVNYFLIFSTSNFTMGVVSRRQKLLLCGLLMKLLSQMQLQLLIINDLITKQTFSLGQSYDAKHNRRNPDCCITFPDLVKRLHKRAFWLMFRKESSCFNAVCSKIESNIGRDKFKSESYLSDLKDKYTDEKKFNMFNANGATTGGYLSGEVSVAITLRVLAGGSKFDIGALFDIHFNSVNRIFWNVMKNWIDSDLFYEIHIKNYLDDPVRARECANYFSEKN